MAAAAARLRQPLLARLVGARPSLTSSSLPTFSIDSCTSTSPSPLPAVSSPPSSSYTSAAASSFPSLAPSSSSSSLLGSCRSYNIQGHRSISHSIPLAAANIAEKEIYNRQRNVFALENRIPAVAPDAWIAPDAVVVGDVDIGNFSAVWYQAVVRGDLNHIHVGGYAHVLERAVLHAVESLPSGLPATTFVGNYSVIGARSVVRSAVVEHECFIGAGCILEEGSVVEAGSALDAGSVVGAGRLIPGGQLWAGNPARFVRELSYAEKAAIVKIATDLSDSSENHQAQYLPNSFAYIEAEALKKSLAAVAK